MWLGARPRLYTTYTAARIPGARQWRDVTKESPRPPPPLLLHQIAPWVVKRVVRFDRRHRTGVAVAEEQVHPLHAHRSLPRHVRLHVPRVDRQLTRRKGMVVERLELQDLLGHRLNAVDVHDVPLRVCDQSA